MGLRFYHIRCPYDILLLAQLSHCTSTPTSLIAANERDHLPDACFYQGHRDQPGPNGNQD